MSDLEYMYTDRSCDCPVFHLPSDLSYCSLVIAGLVVDLLLLGLTRASEIAGPPQVTHAPSWLYYRAHRNRKTTNGDYASQGTLKSRMALSKTRRLQSTDYVSSPAAAQLTFWLSLQQCAVSCSGVEVLLLGVQVPNEFLSFRDTRTETRHPIRLYSRNIDKVHMLLRFNADDSKVPPPLPPPCRHCPMIESQLHCSFEGALQLTLFHGV